MGTGERTLRMPEQNHRWGLESPPAIPLGDAHADVAQLVERWLPKPKVAGSRPVVRFTSALHPAPLAFVGVERGANRATKRQTSMSLSGLSGVSGSIHVPRTGGGLKLG